MIYFDQVSLRHGTKLLFAQLKWTIHRSDKIGLTGANGTGKSSLFALIRGELEEDQGQFHVDKDVTLAHVAQETPALDMPAIDYVMKGDVELASLQKEIERAELCDDGSHLIQLHERLSSHNQSRAYQAPVSPVQHVPT